MFAIKSAATETELASLEADWNALFQSQPNAHITNSFSYLRALSVTLNAGKSWCCFIAYSNSAPIAGVYLVRSRTQVGPLLFSAGDVGTEVVAEILRSPAGDAQVIRDLLRSIFDSSPRLEFLRLPRVRGAELVELQQLVESGGFRCLTRESTFSYWWPTLSATASVLEKVGSSTRKSILKTQRKIDGTLAVGFEVFASSDIRVNRELYREFIELEDSGWKGERGTSITKRPGVSSYYAELLDSFATLGWLRWFRLTHRGKAIASRMCVHCHSTLWMLKAAYDENYAAYRPGQDLLYRILSHCIRDPHVSACDFLGAPEWLDQWRPEKRDHFDFRIFRPGFLGASLWGGDVLRERLSSTRLAEGRRSARRFT